MARVTSSAKPADPRPGPIPPARGAAPRRRAPAIQAAHLLLEQPGRVVQRFGLEGVTADQFGQAIRLVGGRHGDGPHFHQLDPKARLRRAPGGLAPARPPPSTVIPESAVAVRRSSLMVPDIWPEAEGEGQTRRASRMLKNPLSPRLLKMGPFQPSATQERRHRQDPPRSRGGHRGRASSTTRLYLQPSDAHWRVRPALRRFSSRKGAWQVGRARPPGGSRG